MKELELLKKKIDALEKEMVSDNDKLESCLQEYYKQSINDCIDAIGDAIKSIKYIKSL